MKTKPRSIAISSGKGGTGKTMLTANLGIALANQGRNVTILDGDLAMANLAIVMGMHRCPTSFLDVLAGKAEPKDALYDQPVGVTRGTDAYRDEQRAERRRHRPPQRYDVRLPILPLARDQSDKVGGEQPPRQIRFYLDLRHSRASRVSWRG